MAKLGEAKIAKLISSINFFNTKASNIFKLSEILLQKHHGQVPTTMQELVLLPGIGRKTANVVLGNAFNIPSMVVDTHVSRTSQRLGWTHNSTPEKIESDLMNIFPPNEWVDLSHRLILLGRQFCKARKPDCPKCPLNKHCPSRSLHEN